MGNVIELNNEKERKCQQTEDHKNKLYGLYKDMEDLIKEINETKKALRVLEEKQ
jgi:hypothetical protein